MKKLLFVGIAIAMAYTVSAQKSSVAVVLNKNAGTQKVLGAPEGYALQYFTRIKDGEIYYIIFQHIHDSNNVRLFYGDHLHITETTVVRVSKTSAYTDVETTFGTLRFPYTEKPPTLWFDGKVFKQLDRLAK